MKTIGLSFLYFLTGLIFIILPGDSSPILELAVKALIIPLLILIFLVNFRDGWNLPDKLLLAGLIFSWAGDVTLQYNFIGGLAFFLLAHVFYLSTFFATPGKNVIFRQKLYLLIPVIIYGVILVYLLYNDLGAMRLPVILYAIVILTMLAAALNRSEKVNRLSFYLVLAGAILFVISDSVIAIDKFSYNFELSRMVTMSTYVIAQFLIVTGYIRQSKDRLA
jgi:uncharacterized membrane protein YhhN